MRLITTHGELALPEDFALEMTINNPFFADGGSYSIPFSVPASQANLKAIGYPGHGHHDYAYQNSMECLVNYGTWQIRGLLTVTSVSSDSIGMTVAINESELYAQHKDRKLRDILDGISFMGGATIASVASTIQRMMEDDTDDGESLYLAFPVRCTIDEGIDITVNALKDLSDENYINFGNIIYTARSYTSGDLTVNVPDGYGLSVYPRLSRLIKEVFERVELTVVRNDLAGEAYNDIVLLHPCVDLFCSGNGARLSDMVPDITLSDFLVWLHDKFGACVFVKDKEVSIVLMQDAFGQIAPMDISPYIDNDTISRDITEPKGLSISMDTQLADPPAESRLLMTRKWGTPVSTTTEPTAPGLWLLQTTGEYIYIHPSDGRQVIGYDYYPYTSSLDNKEELKTSDVSLVTYRDSHYLPSPLMVHVGRACHYTTTVKDDNDEVSHNLMVARTYFGRPDYTYYTTGSVRATVMGMDPSGSRLFEPLNPDGLHSLFWTRYDGLLWHSRHSATVDCRLPYKLLMSLDISKPVLVNGMRAVVKSIKYTVSSEGVNTQSISLMMLPD